MIDLPGVTDLESHPTLQLDASRNDGLWVAVTDPKRPGRGFDLHIRSSPDGLRVDLWPCDDRDLPKGP